MKHFNQVICIKEGEYKEIKFKIGDIYAIVGDNNAIQMVYKDKIGDTQIMMLHCYGDELVEWTSLNEDNCVNYYPIFTFLEV